MTNMNAEPERWTLEERRRALNAFFESEDGRRFLDVFSRDCDDDEDREVFLRDAERRLRSDHEEANRWWQSLRALVKSHRERDLALAEALAQNGIDVEELYESLPERFAPSALAQAISLVRSVQSGDLAPGISDTAGWPEERILARLEEVRAQLDLPGASENAREWWEAFERENEQRKTLLLRLAEELVIRGATVAEFFDAHVHAGTEDIQAKLHYLDYARRKREEKPTPDANRPGRPGLTTDNTGWWMKPAQKITRIKGWTEEQIRIRLEEVKGRLSWEDADDDVRAWWESFEARNSHRPALSLRMAEELAARETTIKDFFGTYEQSEVEDIRANLHYFDYTRLKATAEKEQEKEEARKQREEERRKNQEERVAKAQARFMELLPLFDTNQPSPELSAEDKAILLNLPRADVPASIRERFEQAIGSFAYETVTLDETGIVRERRQLTARRFVEELVPGVALEMVEIPGGAFLMGTAEADVEKEIMEMERYWDKDRAERWSKTELPRREVSVSPFQMGKFAVTQEQWAVVAGWEKIERDLDADPSHFKGDDRPVEQVSWEDTQEFCARLSRKTGYVYRLPTEAEWEYACRAGATTPFAFGETITTEVVNYSGGSPYAKAKEGENRGETVPVGSLGAANAFGLFDMHGNVWEWCEDTWLDNYEGAPVDGSAWVTPGAPSRVYRGGGWAYGAVDCRSAFRDRNAPGDRNDALGFRLVRTYT
jgi:formylglycine-generating enzyme required for sulfatase activity